MKRGIFVCIFGAMLLASGTSQGQQAAYPTKQVRIVVPYPPGGPTDLIARLLSQKLGERLGQTFYVENVGGASGAVGAGQVAQAAPDGHTLLVVTNDFAVASVTNSKLPYDPVKNFSPVTIIATSPQVVAVNPSVPAKNMKELVDLIKAAPEKYNYAGLGIGFGQLSAERLFKLGLKLDGLVKVPFNGAAPAVSSTLAGHTQVLYLGLPPVAPHLSSDKLRALAVASPKRIAAAPTLPTLDESGLPGFDVTSWYSIVVPAGTPPAVIERLQQEIARALDNPDVRAKLAGLGAEPIANSPAEFAAMIKSETAKWSKIVKDANIKPE